MTSNNSDHNNSTLKYHTAPFAHETVLTPGYLV